MLIVLHLKIFIAFSSFPTIIGGKVAIPFADINYNVGDGEQFIKKVANGEEISDKHDVLMFTAPYKLCDGGCKESEGGNIMVGFPLYIGKKGMNMYKNLYRIDYEKLNSNVNAPFKKRTSRAPYTTFKVYTINIISTVSLPTTSVTISCPKIPPGMCLKKIKPKKNKTITEINSTATITNVNAVTTTSTTTAVTTTAENTTAETTTTDTPDTTLMDDSDDGIMTILKDINENSNSSETNSFTRHKNTNLLRNIKRKQFNNHFRNPFVAANMKKKLNMQVETVKSASDNMKFIEDATSAEYLQESVQLEIQPDYDVSSNTDTNYFGKY